MTVRRTSTLMMMRIQRTRSCWMSCWPARPAEQRSAATTRLAAQPCTLLLARPRLVVPVCNSCSSMSTLPAGGCSRGRERAAWQWLMLMGGGQLKTASKERLGKGAKKASGKDKETCQLRGRKTNNVQLKQMEASEAGSGAQRQGTSRALPSVKRAEHVFRRGLPRSPCRTRRATVHRPVERIGEQGAPSG